MYRDRIFGSFKGEMWTVSEAAREKYGLYWIRHCPNAGFNEEPDTINGGGNSGYQAIHLAATFGARRIILLGFDMQKTNGKDHWHGKHIGGLHNGKGFPRWIAAMKPLSNDLKKRGVEVINASRVTALRCFPRASLEEIFGA